MRNGSERRELHTGRRTPLRRRPLAQITAIVLCAAFLLAVMIGLARRQRTTETIVTRAAAPKVVTITVPVPVPVPTPSPPASPQPPGPGPQLRRVARPPERAEPPRAEPPTESPAQVPHAARTPSAGELAAQYRTVGQRLRTRGDSSTTDALWTRYRRIRLADCLLAEDTRAGCAQVLDAIASDARGQ